MFTETISAAINNIWPMLTIFLVIVITLRIAYLRGSTKGFVFYKEMLSLIFVIYLLLLFELVTKTTGNSGGVNLVPFTEIFRHSLSSKQFIYNVLGNIFVFIPFGYFAASYIKSKSIGQMFIVTFIASLTIELVQFRIGRSFDIDDIILNLIGGILGFLLFVGLKAVKKHLPEMFQQDLVYNLVVIILIVVVVLYYFGISIWRIF